MNNKSPVDQAEQERIIWKWFRLFGGGFHPETRGADYVDASGERALTPAEAEEYEADMARCYEGPADPCGIALDLIKAGSDQSITTWRLRGLTSHLMVDHRLDVGKLPNPTLTELLDLHAGLPHHSHAQTVDGGAPVAVDLANPATFWTYSGHTRRGTATSGRTQKPPEQFVRERYQRRWRDLTVTTPDGSREVGGICPDPASYKRIWWAEHDD